MSKKILLVVGGIIIIVIFIIASYNQAPKTVKYSNNTETMVTSSNVSTENGKQVITIDVKGGYSPKVTNAKANVATIIRAKTNSTFDCSSALRIPAINYSKNLPPSDTTDIEIPNQAAGSSLKGLCSMGMYSFTINFSS
ncbi:MAG: cupredoxin domain-containing protein [Candidatus Falkowbacteria bacterium]|nr:cupredoxin domain-containing protein [Candidatus Falkowbacteria bacterium]